MNKQNLTKHIVTAITELATNTSLITSLHRYTPSNNLSKVNHCNELWTNDNNFHRNQVKTLNLTRNTNLYSNKCLSSCLMAKQNRRGFLNLWDQSRTRSSLSNKQSSIRGDLIRFVDPNKFIEQHKIPIQTQSWDNQRPRAKIQFCLGLKAPSQGLFKRALSQEWKHRLSKQRKSGTQEHSSR